MDGSHSPAFVLQGVNYIISSDYFLTVTLTEIVLPVEFGA